MSESTELVAYDPALFPALVEQDPDKVRERFAARFAQAESMDDLFDVLSGQTSKDMVGTTLTIDAVAWAPFESDRGIIPLAVCDAHDAKTGEVREFVTTSEMLVLFIRRAEIIKALPFTARITSKKTRSGMTALNFERA